MCNPDEKTINLPRSSTTLLYYTTLHWLKDVTLQTTMDEQQDVFNANNKRLNNETQHQNQSKGLITRAKTVNFTICDKQNEVGKSISCSVCLNTQRINCIGLSEIFVNYLNKNNISWLCYGCNKPDCETTNRRIVALSNKINAKNQELDRKIAGLEVKNNTLASQIDTVLNARTKPTSRRA